MVLLLIVSLAERLATTKIAITISNIKLPLITPQRINLRLDRLFSLGLKEDKDNSRSSLPFLLRFITENLSLLILNSCEEIFGR